MKEGQTDNSHLNL